MPPKKKQQEQFHPRLIKCPEVQYKTGLSRTGIYDRVRRGEFPAPVSLGGAAVAWVEAEVDAWVNARIEDRRATASTSDQ